MVALSSLPRLGVGIGFRAEMQPEYLKHGDQIDWFELIADRHLPSAPESFARALEMAKRYRFVPHGLELSIGTDAPLDLQYCTELRALIDGVGAPFYSDHLCFTRAGGYEIGQLTPLPFTMVAAHRCAVKARQVQELLGVPLLLENISYEFTLPGELTEVEFISRVVTEGDCRLLLDLTNLFINSQNHRYDPYAFLAALPLDRVVQVHLAGSEKHAGRWVDSHSQSVDVHPEVWSLLEYVVDRADVKAILIERDQNFPADFDEILVDLGHARDVLQRARQRAVRTTDTLDFQIALARILVEPAARALLGDPASLVRELGINDEQCRALETAGRGALETFAQGLISKRFMLIAKACPVTLKLLERSAALRAMMPQFAAAHVPRETPEYPTRALRDGIWFLDFLQERLDKGELVVPLLGDVIRFERAQLTLSSLTASIKSAQDFRASYEDDPEPTPDTILAARPTRGAHARIERFTTDVIRIVRQVMAGEQVDAVASADRAILFSKLPGARNICHAEMRHRSAQLFELCDGVRTTRAIVALLTGAGDDLAQRTSGCLQLLRELYRINAISLAAPRGR